MLCQHSRSQAIISVLQYFDLFTFMVARLPSSETRWQALKKTVLIKNVLRRFSSNIFRISTPQGLKMFVRISNVEATKSSFSPICRRQIKSERERERVKKIKRDEEPQQGCFSGVRTCVRVWEVQLYRISLYPPYLQYVISHGRLDVDLQLRSGLDVHVHDRTKLVK